MGVRLAVGTMKGAFVLESGDRKTWTFQGPIFKGWVVSAFGRAPGGDYLLATGSSWYVAAIHRSKDLAEWQQIVDGPAYAGDQDRKLTKVWRMITSKDAIFAGVEEAGLFRSTDLGETWDPFEGLNEHPTRPGWYPGAGGLCAHAIVTDPASGRLWCGISAVGVFRSPDGGAGWSPINDGVPKTQEVEDHPSIGYCVHALVGDPKDPDRIWRQDHQGVFRTEDGGETWNRIENGLPAGFGFAMALDQPSGALFVIPMESDEYRLPVGGELRVYRSTDGGDSWQISGTGLPESPTYAGVLRGAISSDGEGGIYFGTTSGTLHYTTDVGETWHTLPQLLPRVLAVQVFID